MAKRNPSWICPGPEPGVLAVSLSGEWDYALIDETDRGFIEGKCWRLHRDGSQKYARNFKRVDGKTKNCPMHRLILDAQPGQIVDHINGNGLDNRRANLRLTDRLGNAWNIGKTQNHRQSKYKGVTRKGGGWLPRVTARSVLYKGPICEHEVHAALVYDALARQHHGEFARTNAALFPEEVARDLGALGVDEWPKEAIGFSMPIRRQEGSWRPCVGDAHKLLGKSSKYRGVSRDKYGWRAFASVEGRRLSLGSFRVERDAALAYDAAVLEQRGPDAVTNAKLGLL